MASLKAKLIWCGSRWRWKSTGTRSARGAGREAAGLGDHGAAQLVVGDQFVAAGVQALEGQLVARQHQHVGGDLGFQLAQGAQVEAERVAVRLDRPHADVGGDLGQHLVGGEEQLVGGAIKHDLLGGMAVAGE